MTGTSSFVTPAKAGAHLPLLPQSHRRACRTFRSWAPAFAGVTALDVFA